MDRTILMTTMMNQDHSLTSKFIIKLTQGTMNIQSLIKHLTITMTNHSPMIPPHTIQHMELQPIRNLQLTKLITNYHTTKIHQNPIVHLLHITHLLLTINQPTRLTMKVLIIMKIQLQQPMAHLDHLIKALIKVIDKVQYHMDPIHHKVMDRDQDQIVRDHIKVINPTKLMEAPINPTAIYQRPTGTWKGLGLITPILMGYHPLTQFMVENLIKVVGPILTNRIHHLIKDIMEKEQLPIKMLEPIMDQELILQDHTILDLVLIVEDPENIILDLGHII